MPLVNNIKCKVSSLYRTLVEKEPKKPAKVLNILENEINNAEKLQTMSMNELKDIARLRRIKNRDKLKREDLIIIILKSESSNAEHNYMKHFNNNANDDNNNNTNDNNNNTYDGKIISK